MAQTAETGRAIFFFPGGWVRREEQTMGILDGIIKGVGSKILEGEGQSELLEQVFSLINNPQNGGLSGIVEQLTNKGLGGLVSSWIGTGENQPVSGEQIEQTFGSEKIQEIAQKLGISGVDASGGLAALLPQIIDRLTPEGKLPEGGILDQGLDFLKKNIFSG
jgi:uncharacterized protein YidB (DUF937 family)